MSSDRIQQIQELFHAAREGSVAEREVLLARADPDLRCEVESLLARQSDELLLHQPAVEPHPQVDPDSSMPAVGTRLGPYRVEGKLGEGGMGAVFRAVDTRLGRAVAIKIAHERFSARFEREARAISSLNHPNICTLHDVGPNYLVMELVEGETLASGLKKGPLPAEVALGYARQILAALAEAHSGGIIHRDLKPGNVMLTKTGAKVLDFGLATLEGDTTTFATEHMVMGTPAYMAPEQRVGKPADARTDLYSFGCVLYEMLTGVRATAERKRLPAKKLERIVSRCLEPDPAGRWHSAVELANALAAPPSAFKKRVWMVPATVVFVALLIAAFFFRPAPKLTDKDIVVLADFVNNTGDSIFEGALRQGLAIQLEQSPFLKIMDDEEMHRVLRLMSLSPGARITNPVAHEICVRGGAAATIGGDIASLGKSYVITLQAIACQNGATLAREQIQAADKEHVLNAVGTAATAIRAKLGESRNSIEKLNRPLEKSEATTASLEALQNYAAALSESEQGHFLAAVPLLERAVALDPNFAAAYEYLGVMYEQAGDLVKKREYEAKAFALIDRVSEWERDQIAASYYENTGELDKALDAYRSGIRNYPRYWGFFNDSSADSIDLGQYEEALQGGLEAARLQPDVEPPYRRQLDAYLCLNRFAEGRQLREKLQQSGIGGSRIHQRFLELAYIDGDGTAVEREIQWFAGKPEEYLSLGLQAAERNVHGQRRESHELFRRAADTAVRLGLRDVAAEFDEADAQDDALLGYCQTARRLGRPALALALCGDAAPAEKLAAETSKLFPNGTIWNAVRLPEIRAAIALKRDQPAESVRLLASASPYESAYLAAIYLRGLAYLRLNKGAEAAGEFQKIVDHKGANWANDWRHPSWAQFYSLSYLGVARGSALAGDTAKARKAFEDFLALWKDADPEIPILKQAKAEYSKLQ
jgi:tetratricopeptide (TPR) repeat protein